MSFLCCINDKDYVVTLGNYLDKDKKYRILMNLGSGAFGKVVSVHNSEDKKVYAAKIINEYYNGDVEIYYSKKLNLLNTNNLTGIVKYIDSFDIIQNNTKYSCIILEKHGKNLYYYLQKKYVFDINKIAKITYELAQTIYFFHKNKLVHSDIKTENILYDTKNIKICDYGNILESSHNSFNIQTLYYRAPEIVFKHSCGSPIDIWSLGCVLYELATSKTLFNATSNENLKSLYYYILGTLDFYDSKFEPGVKTFYANRSIKDVIDEDLRDLISQCLKYDPYKRITAHDILTHSFITKNLLLI